MSRVSVALASDAPVPASSTAMEEELRRLRAETDRLRVQLAAASEALAGRGMRSPFVTTGAGAAAGAGAGAPAALPLLRASSLLADGTKVKMTEPELAGMRAVFSTLDTNGDGFVTRAQLASLFVRLGEPIAAEDLDAILADWGTARLAHEAGPEAVASSIAQLTLDFDSFARLWNDHVAALHDASDVSEGEGDGATPATPATASSKLLEARRRRRDAYRARFKFLKARLPSAEVARVQTEVRGSWPSVEVSVWGVGWEEDGGEGQQEKDEGGRARVGASRAPAPPRLSPSPLSIPPSRSGACSSSTWTP
jgi:hypothetical protein